MVKKSASNHSKPCPICKREASQEFHPFCSKRCADEDLNSWLGGKYTIPVTEMDDEDELNLQPEDARQRIH